MNLANKWEIKIDRLLKIIENLKRRLDDCDMRIHTMQEVTHPPICNGCEHLEIEHYDDGAGTTGCDAQIFNGGSLYDCHCKRFEVDTNA